MIHQLLRRLCFAFCIVISASSSFAQDCEPTWAHNVGFSGTNDTINAMVEWDPDGDGPQPKVLVVAGSFYRAGSTAAHYIATWDGHEFRQLGAGLAGPAYSLAVYQGTVFAGGSGLIAVGSSGACLVRWDGSAWQPVVTGGVSVNALIEYQGDLVLAGFFNTVSDKQYNNIARWNGSLQQFGSGLNNTVRNLCVYRGELIASGAFTKSGTTSTAGIARWDGLSWKPLGTGITGSIRTMAVFHDELIVGGGISAAGGVLLTALARWDGFAWSPVPSDASFTVQDVSALTIRSDALLAAATLNSSATTTTGLASWNGSAWTRHVGDISGTPICFTPFQDQLFIGGTLDQAGRIPVKNLVRWDGDVWRSVGEGTALPKQLFAAGGKFYLKRDNALTARWEGDCWRSTFSDPEGAVTGAFFSYNDQMVACVAAESGSGCRLLRFDDPVWTPLGGVFDLGISRLTDFNGHLVVAGSFSRVDNTACSSVALWDGASWNQVGEALWTFGQAHPVITAIGSFRGDLIAVGDFNRAGNVVIKTTARWNGSTWSQMPVATGNALLNHRDRLFLIGFGGDPYIWDGSKWTLQDSGGPNGSIDSVARFQGRLLAAGIGLGPQHAALAEWKGFSWQPFGPQLVGSTPGGGAEATSMVASGNTVFVSGYLDSAGEAFVSSTCHLTACPVCPTDLNGDSLIDDADFCNFVVSYNLMDCSDPVMPASCPADFNGDGLVDDADFTRFVADYAAFHCPLAD